MRLSRASPAEDLRFCAGSVEIADGAVAVPPSLEILESI
jgi:hypothetical protein